MNKRSKGVAGTETWDPIHGFRSLNEYERFARWLEQAIEAGVGEEVPVHEPYSGGGFRERWIRETATGVVWRLVTPDPPFRGVFLPVHDRDKESNDE